MIVYIDLYFLMNVQMNLVLLWMEGILLKRKFRFGRFVLAAVVSALLAVLYLVSGIGARWFLTIPFTLSTWFLTIRLAFGKITKISFVRNYVVHGLLGFFLSGFLYYAARAVPVGKGYLFFTACSGLCLFAVWKKRETTGEFSKQRNLFIPFVLKKGGQMAEGMAFLDTGNQLREPFSGSPVCLGEKKCLQSLLQGAVSRPIPYHMADGKSGYFQGFCMDEMILGRGKNKKHYKQVWIAVGEKRISQDGEFDLILNQKFQ